MTGAQRLPHLLALALRISTKFIDQRDSRARKEWRNRNVRNRVLPDSEAVLGGEERLDVLDGLVEFLDGPLALEEVVPGGVELRGDALDEEARLSAQDGV